MTDHMDLLAERFGDPADDLRAKPPRQAPLEPALSKDDWALLEALERTEGERAARRKRGAG